MAAKLTTHVLDTARGRPAQGMKIELWLLQAESRKLLTTAITNPDGRIDRPLLAGDDLKAGQYELLFFVGDYFATRDETQPGTRFLDRVPVRFGIGEPAESYHVPLLCSPWAYSTYRGS